MSNLALVPASPIPGHSLLTAAEVGSILRINPKKVYELKIPRVVLSTRRIRWREQDVIEYIERSRAA